MVNFKKYIVEIIKRNKLGMLCALLFSVIVCILDLIKPKLTESIIDNAINSNTKKIYIIGLIYILVIIFSTSLTYIVNCYHNKVKKSFSLDLKKRVLNHISNLSGEYFTNKKTGELLKIVEGDIFNLENIGIDLLIDICINTVSCIISLIILISIDIKLLVVVLLIQLLMILIEKKYMKIVYNQSEEVRNYYGISMNLIEQYISNIMNVVITKSKDMLISHYITNEKKSLKKSLELESNLEKNQNIAISLNEIMIVSIYIIGGVWIIKGNMTFGVMMAFIQYSQLVLGPFMKIMNSNSKIQSTIISVNRIYKLLQEPVQDNLSAEIYDKKLIGDIEIKNLNFSYDNNNIVLKDINMSFLHGKTTAIVGHSGCGKSTITKLLYRLWNVKAGSIIIDKYPIEKYDLDFLRKNIAVITQDIVLFDDSILNNITLNRKIDLDKLDEICEKVELKKMILELPDGYNTIVGENGIKLSGGQKQRISIARALLEDTPIIILDEATSALDNLIQDKILKNIEDIFSNKTTIIIAHRLSTIKNADYIYVIDKKTIIEEGTHTELISREGVYKRMVKDEK